MTPLDSVRIFDKAKWTAIFSTSSIAQQVFLLFAHREDSFVEEDFWDCLDKITSFSSSLQWVRPPELSLHDSHTLTLTGSLEDGNGYKEKVKKGLLHPLFSRIWFSFFYFREYGCFEEHLSIGN